MTNPKKMEIERINKLNKHKINELANDLNTKKTYS